MRRFLFGWSGLEIFVNSVFVNYEDKIYAALGEGPQLKLRAASVARIRNVMKDKYRLVDKFILVALGVDARDGDKDAAAFLAAKKSRDALLHGEQVDETDLPTKSVRDLLVKYLQLHLGGSPRLCDK